MLIYEKERFTIFMNVKKTLKKVGAYLLTLTMLGTSAIALPSISAGAFASPSERKMENLDRGVVAMKVTNGTYITWRRLATEPADTVFTLYRNKEKVAEGAITNYSDPDGKLGDNYTVVCNGTMSSPAAVLADNYIEIPMAETPVSDTMISNREGIYYGSYTPGDGTYADLDGDGEYEVIVLWCPPDALDAASVGRTGKAYVDAYKLDGTFMWRVDMGYNIRAGAHDTMLMCADFDGDGAAEMILRTADGTIDGEGNIIGDPSKGATYEDSWAALNGGKNLQGPLYVTCFDGETGKALDTIDYYPQNTIGSMETCYSFGDDFGNRCERYNSTLAYLDGNLPSVVMGRGYYFGKNGRQRQAAAAYDFRGGKLTLRWAFDTETGYDGYKSGNELYVGQGNHQLEAADVDGDGKDEVTTGALWYDDDGTVLWSSQLEHGDVVHVGDFDPTIEGLEEMTAKEDYAAGGEHFLYSNPVLTSMGIQDALGADTTVGEQVWGIVLQQAKDGKFIQVVNGTKDTGRGMIGNIGYGDSWYVMWGAAGTGYQDNNGNKLSDLGLSMNGRIYWDGDLQDELQDHRGAGMEISISKWNDSAKKVEEIFVPEGTHSINSTKGNTCGQGDMIGDWREEFVSYVITDEKVTTETIEVPANWDKTITAEVDKPVMTYALRVYTTNIPTDYNFYTLAHDDVYRNSSGTYNNCYNQPPHISWYMNDHVAGSEYTTQPESKAVLVPNKYTAKAFDESALPEAGEAPVTVPDTGNEPADTDATPAPAEPGDFTDTTSHWARETIKEMALANIIDGMGDGTFRPDGTVTKGQFVKLVVSALGFPAEENSSSHWAAPYVKVASAANILSKNIDVSNLDSAISREEMASIVARAAAYKGLTAEGKSFTDSASVSSWAADDVSTAAGLGIINGYEDNSFRPANAATRAEAAVMLSRLYSAIK